jgi:hypothetical protein
MSPRSLAVTVALLLSSCGGASDVPARTAGAPTTLRWREWSRAAFEEARHGGKPILLSVQAGWCHWCHVMNDTTYRDPEVVALLAARFVPIRVDGDARPDLAERYRRYAWPATVFLTPDGTQILGLRGYRNPTRFSAILADVLEAHRQGRTLDEASRGGAAAPEELDALRRRLLAQLDRQYDPEAGGWGRRQRYPFAAPVEHAFFRAAVRDEARWERRALHSLAQYARLIDPVFGGMYQYSVGGVWDRPHFEKIVPVQAGALRAFARAYRVSADARWLRHAEAIHRYVRDFLRADDGAFYTSQDADLGGHGQPGPHVPGEAYYGLDEAGRRALGIPRIDRHVYAATNGMLIAALVDLHAATVASSGSRAARADGSDPRAPTPPGAPDATASQPPPHAASAAGLGASAALDEARRAAERIERTHRRPRGLYAHDAEAEDPLFYLADQAHLLEAWIALFQATGEPRWLTRAAALAEAMTAHLAAEGGGFVAHTEDPRAEGFFAERRVPIDDNATAARALLALSRLTDEARWRALALAALRAAARPSELRRMGRMVGPYLLALEHLAAGHLLLSVVGPPDDPRTGALHRAALALDEPTRLVELGRPGESRYPYPGEPTVFLCSRDACSLPITTPADLPEAARRFLRR